MVRYTKVRRLYYQIHQSYVALENNIEYSILFVNNMEYSAKWYLIDYEKHLLYSIRNADSVSGQCHVLTTGRR